jgi:methylglutaconyl-CoA hydratase
MQKKFIKQEIFSRIMVVTLNRPEVRNALNPQLIDELMLALDQTEQNKEVKVMIFRAEGKTFCAGADLQWMKESAKYTRKENIHDASRISQLMEKLNNLSKPTICLMQGSAFGGGVGLVACCDIIIAAIDVEMCFSEVKIGLIPAVISPYAIQKIGLSAARRYFLTGEMISAQKAYDIGLVHEIVPQERLEETGNTIAEQILKNGPEAVQKIKKLTQFLSYPPISKETIDETIQAIADCRSSKEGQEGLEAFLEKRRPQWL